MVKWAEVRSSSAATSEVYLSILICCPGGAQVGVVDIIYANQQTPLILVLERYATNFLRQDVRWGTQWNEVCGEIS